MTDLISIASAALGLTLIEPIALGGSDRSAVLRCRTPADGTVVVKSYPATAEGEESYSAETAGLSFIAGTGIGPDLLAADPRHRVIVMSDLGTAPSLADLLLGPSPERAGTISHSALRPPTGTSSRALSPAWPRTRYGSRGSAARWPSGHCTR